MVSGRCREVRIALYKPLIFHVRVIETETGEQIIFFAEVVGSLRRSRLAIPVDSEREWGDGGDDCPSTLKPTSFYRGIISSTI